MNVCSQKYRGTTRPICRRMWSRVSSAALRIAASVDAASAAHCTGFRRSRLPGPFAWDTWCGPLFRWDRRCGRYEAMSTRPADGTRALSSFEKRLGSYRFNLEKKAKPCKSSSGFHLLRDTEWVRGRDARATAGGDAGATICRFCSSCRAGWQDFRGCAHGSCLSCRRRV